MDIVERAQAFLEGSTNEATGDKKVDSLIRMAKLTAEGMDKANTQSSKNMDMFIRNIKKANLDDLPAFDMIEDSYKALDKAFVGLENNIEAFIEELKEAGEFN